MRKSLLTSILIIVLSVPYMHGQCGLRPRGDVNCDWELSVADLNTMVDAVVSGTTYHSFYTYAYDINGDKEINIADINLLVDGLLGAELKPMPAYSGSLPVLFINTEDYQDIVSKEDYLNAVWWLDATGIDGYESIG